MGECIVSTEQGQLRGKTCADYRGRVYFSFQGVPYAKAPLGQLRFKAPEAPESWTGIKEATNEKPGCFSHHIYFQHIVGSEDCLYLNVYTPQLPKAINGLKPVMVFVHGGAFLRGSASTEFFGPEFLVHQDVVLVTFNYRVGIFGFLSLEDSRLGVPGNAGLKDQVMALKWIQKNIQNFGGNPHNVTLFGISAGGASVHYLMLSPLTKGLFHRVIAQSGSALMNPARGSRKSQEIADILKLDDKHEENVLKQLRSLPVEKLLEVQDSVKEILNISSVRTFAPIVEKPSSEPAIITKDPLEIIKSGHYNKVPFLLGHTDNEALLFEPLTKHGISLDFRDYELCVPHELKLPKGSDLSKEVAGKIRDFYEEVTHISEGKNLILRGDLFVNRSSYVAAKLHSEIANQSVYFYVFSADTQLNTYKKIMSIAKAGASHVDDIGYLFKTAYTPKIDPNSPEEFCLKKVTSLWTNFAKHGNPNANGASEDPLWKPVEPNDFNYLNIGNELRADKNPNKPRMDFWEDIYKLYA